MIGCTCKLENVYLRLTLFEGCIAESKMFLQSNNWDNLIVNLLGKSLGKSMNHVFFHDLLSHSISPTLFTDNQISHGVFSDICRAFLAKSCPRGPPRVFRLFLQILQLAACWMSDVYPPENDHISHRKRKFGKSSTQKRQLVGDMRSFPRVYADILIQMHAFQVQ